MPHEDFAEARPGHVPVGNLTIAELFTSLRPSDLYGILGAIGATTAIVFGIGFKAGTHTVPHVPIDPITAARPEGAIQVELRKRPAVAAFERCLNAAAAEQWSDAYSLMSNSWKRTYERAEDLAKAYRMTKEHQYKYYIPIESDSDHETYLVDLGFSDYMPQLPNRVSISATNLGAALTPDLVNRISRELARTLPENYTVPPSESAAFPGKVQTYVSEVMTVRDLVVRDDIIEELGLRFHYAPIVMTPTYQGKSPPIEKRRLCRLTMVKEGGQWKLDSYDSIMREKL